jgi:hypothetical protein
MPRVKKMSGGALGAQFAELRGTMKPAVMPRPAVMSHGEEEAIAAHKERMVAMQRPGGKPSGKGIGKKLLKGAKFLGKELYDIAAPVAKEIARDMVKQKLQEYSAPAGKAPAGKGLYAAMRGKGMRMKMSAAQVRTLKKGGAIQLKPAMFEDMGRYAMEFKPQIMSMVEKALAKNKGMRVSMEDIENLMDMKKGKGIDFEGLVRDTAKYLQPTADAAQDRAIKEIRGGNIDFERLVRDTGKYLQPVADAAQDRAIKEIKGSGRKGRKKKGTGALDFLKKIERALDPVTSAIEQSGVPSLLIREGLPMATGALGGIAGTTLGGPKGGVAGAMLGRELGKRIGKRQAEKYGYGLYAGSGMKKMKDNPYMGGVGDVIQTGAPYISHASPAYHPFKEKYNPFT